jgi:type IV secretion system protein VirD4
MVVMIRLLIVAGAVGTFVTWSIDLSWLWPWLALPTSVAFLGAALMDDRTVTGSRTFRRPIMGGLRAVDVGVTDNHGHASWMSMQEASRIFAGPTPNYGGVVVGEAYQVHKDRTAGVRFAPRDRRSWGNGGQGKLLIDPCTDGPTHSLLFAGAGGFKTTSAVTTILRWHGNSVVFDPSCEVGPMVRDALALQGKQTHFLDPARPQDAVTWGFNVLDWIDTKKPLAEMHVHTVVAWLFGDAAGQETEEQFFFRQWGKDLVACLLAHLLWDDEATAPKTLVTLRVGIVTPEKRMRRLLRSISTTSKSMMARHLASSLVDVVDETFSGIYANANQGTAWLSVPAFAELVSGDAFRTGDLVSEPTTVFVQIPLPALMTAPGLGRVIIGALLNAAYEAQGEAPGRTLFLLDEVARLGRMKVIETARDVGRKYGITLQLLYQSVGQLEEQWGREGRRAWYDSVSWRGYAAVQDLDTARELSALCGEHGVLAYSEGQNSGSQRRMGFSYGSRSKGRNLNVHEIRRPLIKPDELIQDTRADELFVIARGCKPLRCGRAIYFRRPEVLAQVQTSRFSSSKGDADGNGRQTHAAVRAGGELLAERGTAGTTGPGRGPRSQHDRV